MNATIIDFNKKVIAVEDHKSILKVRSIPNGVKFENGSRINFFGGIEKTYQMIELNSYDKAYKKFTRRFFINQEDAEIAFPIIDAMVRNRAMALEEEKEVAMKAFHNVKEDMKIIEGYWFNRLWKWVLLRFTK